MVGVEMVGAKMFGVEMLGVEMVGVGCAWMATFSTSTLVSRRLCHN